MAQPIDLMVNLAQVGEIGRLRQVERDRPEGEKEHKALVIKTNSHLSEEQVEAMAQDPVARVESRNEGGSFAGFGRRKRKKKEEEEEEKKEDLLYLPSSFRPDSGRYIDVVR